MGNQGVGKNKITDTFLERLHLPRQYIQLHRGKRKEKKRKKKEIKIHFLSSDTTVQSLTLQPSLEEGRITWIDSPLVIAATKGHVLGMLLLLLFCQFLFVLLIHLFLSFLFVVVVDEADKAPLEVVCILKGLGMLCLCSKMEFT
jgi:hypothetical protein